MTGKRRYGPEIQWDQEAIVRACDEHGVDCFANLWPWRPYFVYRVFDATDTLLYIGCTMAPWQRFTAHRAQSAWYPRAARVTWQFAGQQADARWVERKAIMSERPLHNVMLNAPRVAA